MALRWLAAAIMLAAALCARAADAEIRIGVAGPMTGANAWFGEQYQRGTELAVEDLNANGGVLGQSVELIVGDDFCDPDQAVALARKLVSDGVVFVAGHWCSHSAIPASKIYEQSEILMIAPGAISSKLTDEGGPNSGAALTHHDFGEAAVLGRLAECGGFSAWIAPPGASPFVGGGRRVRAKVKWCCSRGSRGSASRAWCARCVKRLRSTC